MKSIKKTRAHPFFLSDLLKMVKTCSSKGRHDQKICKENTQWIDNNFEISLTYNTKRVHSATGLVPAEARKPKNEIQARLNI